MRALRLLVLLPILAILAGCFGSAPPVPKEQYFRLMAAQPAAQSPKKITGGIEIVPFAGEGVMSERPLLFSADGGQAGATQLRLLDGCTAADDARPRLPEAGRNS